MFQGNVENGLFPVNMKRFISENPVRVTDLLQSTAYRYPLDKTAGLIILIRLIEIQEETRFFSPLDVVL